MNRPRLVIGVNSAPIQVGGAMWSWSSSEMNEKGLDKLRGLIPDHEIIVITGASGFILLPPMEVPDGD